MERAAILIGKTHRVGVRVHHGPGLALSVGEVPVELRGANSKNQCQIGRPLGQTRPYVGQKSKSRPLKSVSGTNEANPLFSVSYGQF